MQRLRRWLRSQSSSCCSFQNRTECTFQSRAETLSWELFSIGRTEGVVNGISGTCSAVVWHGCKQWHLNSIRVWRKQLSHAGFESAQRDKLGLSVTSLTIRSRCVKSRNAVCYWYFAIHSSCLIPGVQSITLKRIGKLFHFTSHTVWVQLLSLAWTFSNRVLNKELDGHA